MALAECVLTQGEFDAVSAELGISPRQREIVRCLLTGMTDKEIATDIGITIPTVRTHLGRLFDKLQVGDRVELILLFVERFRDSFYPRRS